MAMPLIQQVTETLMHVGLIGLEDEVDALRKADYLLPALVPGDALVGGPPVRPHLVFVHDICAKWYKPRTQNPIDFNPPFHHLLGEVLDGSYLSLPDANCPFHASIALGCPHRRLDRNRLPGSCRCHCPLKCNHTYLLVRLHGDLLALVAALVEDILELLHNGLGQRLRLDANRQERTYEEAKCKNGANNACYTTVSTV